MRLKVSQRRKLIRELVVVVIVAVVAAVVGHGNLGGIEETPALHGSWRKERG